MSNEFPDQGKAPIKDRDIAYEVAHVMKQRMEGSMYALENASAEPEGSELRRFYEERAYDLRFNAELDGLTVQRRMELEPEFVPKLSRLTGVEPEEYFAKDNNLEKLACLNKAQAMESLLAGRKPSLKDLETMDAGDVQEAFDVLIKADYEMVKDPITQTYARLSDIAELVTDTSTSGD